MIKKMVQTISSRLRAAIAGAVMLALTMPMGTRSASPAASVDPVLMHPLGTLMDKEAGRWSPRAKPYLSSTASFRR